MTIAIHYVNLKKTDKTEQYYWNGKIFKIKETCKNIKYLIEENYLE